MAERILCLADGALAEWPYQDAIARYKAGGMLYGYFRFSACLQCHEWLQRAKTDPEADTLLRHLASLLVELGEPTPPCLRDWMTDALFSAPLKHSGRRNMNWKRNYALVLAVDLLVELTGSSVENAMIVVADVCREKQIFVAEVETFKKIRHRVRKDAKTREAEAGADAIP